jgi:hypothetical protein
MATEHEVILEIGNAEDREEKEVGEGGKVELFANKAAIAHLNLVAVVT